LDRSGELCNAPFDLALKKSRAARIDSRAAEFFFNPQQLIIFCDPI
jgi:hypothetical protein